MVGFEAAADTSALLLLHTTLVFSTFSFRDTGDSFPAACVGLPRESAAGWEFKFDPGVFFVKNDLIPSCPFSSPPDFRLDDWDILREQIADLDADEVTMFIV